MKIISLQAENFKRLVAVEINPDGNVVQITGKNGQGKTSVLDAIWVALAGMSAAPLKPIRDGQEQARVRLDLGEIIITRTFKIKKDGVNFTSQITAENEEGSKFPSPQRVIDDLLGSLCFDPLAFSRMKPKDQFDTMRSFVPGVDFEAIESENKADYARRTELNRRAKEAKTLLESIVVPADTPAERIDESGLIDALEKGGEKNRDIEVRRANRAKLAEHITQEWEAVERIEKQINDLKEMAEKHAEEARGSRDKLDKVKPLSELTDLSMLRKDIEEAKAINTKVAMREEKDEHMQSFKSLQQDAYAMTLAMDKRNKEKVDAIAAAKLPVVGIGFGDGIVLMNDLPFSQASDAEQLRASIAIAMAMNPKLKVVRVRDGSLLDEDSMKLLAKMAEEKDCQVWIERVDSSGKVGFVLEDGQVKENLEEGDA